MKYIYCKYEHYQKFNEQNSIRLSKGLKLATNTKSILLKEIFTSPVQTNYHIENNDDESIIISFYSNKNNKYRIDIFKFLEEDKSEFYISHLAFSDYKNDPNSIEYENILNRHEMIEVLNRIHFILKDLVDKEVINNFFCIGGAELIQKNAIYEYVLKVIVGENGFEKLPTTFYISGYGLYFEI